MTRYAELAVTTNFTFLSGASHPADLVAEAIRLGHAGIGIADRNSVAGVVRAYSAWLSAEETFREEHGKTISFPFRLVVGARLAFADGTPDILAYPENREGWGDLCRLLTIGNRRAEKGDCILRLDDLLTRAGNLLLVVMPSRDRPALEAALPHLAEAAPGAAWLAASMLHRGDDRRRLAGLKAIAARHRLPLMAVNDVLYHHPDERDLQDILTCIREKVTIDTAGRRLEANAERHLKEPAEMARLFRDAPEAILETGYFLDRIDFSLGQLKYEYPDEPIPPGRTPQGWLEELTWRRARLRYPGGVPEKVARLLEEELRLIEELKYAPYFLTIHDIVCYAEDHGILCQGRGSAANSAVCYVLGITAVDPSEHELLFARFISTERREPPDIDVDFEHERREEVIQHIYKRYGRERAGIAATVISYRPRSAIREVGKALGLTEDVTARLAGTVWGSWGSEIVDSQIREAGLDPKNPTLRRAVGFATRLLGFPRHLSQHVGGFVLARDRLDELVPIGNAAMEDRTFIEWDKDDIDVLGLMKVDVLGLGILTCIRKGFALIEQHGGGKPNLDMPTTDPHVYDMLKKGDSIGVFQVESRAQINMLPRLRPENLYDLVIQVAIVRPGPIQGDMVHPYLRRRNKEEEEEYPRPAPPHDPRELRHVLERTLGVPLFQEQAMKMAMVAARFTPEEANGLRRAMATFRHNGTIHEFEAKMVEGMVARGYERPFAERCFNQIKGFGEYGFPESHAVSFAKLVYVSAWIKCHHPAAFACALLNSQPMGFYAPAQIVRDAREHGVEVRPVDVNFSHYDNTLERREDGSLALRLGLRQVDGFHEDWADALAEARQPPYRSVEDLWRRVRLPQRAFKLLADADACRSLDRDELGSARSKLMNVLDSESREREAGGKVETAFPDPARGLDRREALWAVRRLPDDTTLPLFAAAAAEELAAEPDAALPKMPLSEHVVADYQTIRLSLKAHPMAFLRDLFRSEGAVSAAELAALPDGAFARHAGVVLIRQRPGKGNAIFMTLEDETGIVNALFWARVFERFRSPVMGAKLALVEGRVQKSKEGVVHLMATAIHDRTRELARLSDADAAGLAPAGEAVQPGGRHPRNVRIIPKSRDFH